MSLSRTAAPGVGALDHEVKFVLPAAAAPAARALLAGVCRPETPHARSRVSTIYFDSRNLDSAAEKWASDYRKTKVRLRWYDGAGAVMLEVKRRVGSRREKLRFPTPLDGRELEAGGLAAAAGGAIPAFLAGLGVAAAADLAPALRLAYDRERFVGPGETGRISLDTRLVAGERAAWCEGADLESGDPGDLDVALVELKGHDRGLPPALLALASLGAKRRSFSKYTACLSCGSV
jgi:hypothetical protein